MKKLLALLLLPFTLCADLITTFDFDIEESALSFLRPNWGNTNDIFYYNIAYFTVDTGGDWTASNSSITSHDSFDYTNEQVFQNNPWYAADTYIYLYDDVFVPSNPTLNLIAEDDDGYDGGNGYQFDLTYNIKKDHVYWAVITTFEPEEEIGGAVDIYGPQGAGITMVIIPEPAALGLIIGGASLILLLRKRK
tara:strand:- start:198 stop:776 length:579 start_codon:yes stop_codon:yes gene_type:complete